MIKQKIIDLALKQGFTHVAPLDPATLELLPEVRDMCSTNSCGKYDKNWACPPACGTLDECREKISTYSKGILVQTMGELEDAMDFETMMELEEKHKKNFLAFRVVLTEIYPELLALGAGACSICKECAYPDAPCRFPEKCVSSMEAFGILVNKTCTANNMLYYYGPNTLAYTSCYLF